MVFQQHLIGDVGRLPRQHAAHMLPPDQNGFANRQPNIAHNAAVVPPVVPNRVAAAQRHRIAGDSGETGPIIDLHGDKVGGAELRPGIHPPLCMAAFVRPGFHAVEPYAGLVERGAEVQFHALISSARRQCEGAEIPRHAFIVGVLADVPRVRNGHRLGGRRNVRGPALGHARSGAIDGHAPLAIQVDALGGGCSDKHCRQQDDSSDHKLSLYPNLHPLSRSFILSREGSSCTCSKSH